MSQLLPLLLALACPLGVIAMMAAPAVARLVQRRAKDTPGGQPDAGQPASAPLPEPAMADGRSRSGKTSLGGGR